MKTVKTDMLQEALIATILIMGSLISFAIALGLESTVPTPQMPFELLWAKTMLVLVGCAFVAGGVVRIWVVKQRNGP